LGGLATMRRSVQSVEPARYFSNHIRMFPATISSTSTAAACYSVEKPSFSSNKTKSLRSLSLGA
jgi:hypothetical protein